MAENVVIASISLDDTQVAGATQRVRAGLGGIEGGVAALTNRMFNLRQAATALLGGFTLAGIILKLGQITSALITNTATWKAWADAAADAIQRVMKGADALGRLGRQLKELGPGGVNSLVLMTERIPALMKQRELLAEAMMSPTGVPTTLADLFLGPGGESEDRIAAMKSLVQRDLSSITLEFEKLRTELGLTQKQWQTLFPGAPLPDSTTVMAGAGGAGGGAKAPSLFSIFGIASPEDIQKVVGAANDAVRVFSELGKANSLFPLDKALEAIRSKLEGIGLTSTQIEQLVPALAHVRVEVEANTTKFEILTTLASQFAASFGAALDQGRFSFRSFIADMLRGVGHTLLAWGALGLVMAHFGYGPGLKASAIAFAAGTAAILAANALAPSSSPSGGGGGNESAVAPAGGGNTQNVQIYFQGNLASDEWMRGAVIDIQKALADGAGGGSF